MRPARRLDHTAAFVERVEPRIRVGLDAILIWSTNLPGFEVAASLETELGVPVIDSASAGVWGSLALLRIDPSPARPFGRIFGLAG